MYLFVKEKNISLTKESLTLFQTSYTLVHRYGKKLVFKNQTKFVNNNNVCCNFLKHILIYSTG